MLTKSLSKVVRSLKIKKYRSQHGLYLAEGRKIVQEALTSGQQITHIVGSSDFIDSLGTFSQNIETITIKKDEVSALSSLKNNEEGLALVRIPSPDLEPPILASWTIYLDRLQDPGNLGTIIRTADWFGLQEIFCSPNTCDLYNPKSVMAAMGSLFRVKVRYISIDDILRHNPTTEVLGADMQGQPIHEVEFGQEGSGLIVFGNEANGIDAEMLERLSGKISIPGEGRAESLNVAQSSAIILSQMYFKGVFR